MPRAQKQPKVLHYIVCDDIRREQGNKITLVGCYGDQIFTDAEFPTALARLCIFFRIANVTKTTTYTLEVQTPKRVRDGKSAKAKSQGTLERTEIGEIKQLGITASPFHLPAPGEYKGRLTLGGARAYSFSFHVVRRKQRTKRKRK